VQAWEIAEAEKVHDIFRRTASFKNTTFCFLFASTKLDENARKNELINYCNVARLRFPENTKVVGICANMSMEQYGGYMFAYLEIPVMSEEFEKEVSEYQSRTGILKSPQITKVREDEFPI
jgi:hypothetical protein